MPKKEGKPKVGGKGQGRRKTSGGSGGNVNSPPASESKFGVTSMAQFHRDMAAARGK